MKRMHGFTLLELLGALTIGSIMMLGLFTMIDASLADTKGQQAAQHQSQVASAATKYISANYASLTGLTDATTPVAITVATLIDNNYLSRNFLAQNAYGQTPCILILQPTPNKLEALIVTEGGIEIPAKDIPYVAANAGQGGGYIALPPNALEATGAFGSWKLSTSSLTIYLNQKCSAVAAGPGHLATALFYSGNGQLSTDFLYRDAVPGRPELNRMNTPLHILDPAVTAVEDTSDANCTIANTATSGGISTNAQGEVLSCQNGFWRRQTTTRMNQPLHILNSPVPAVENTSDANCTIANMATLGGISTNIQGEVLSCQNGFWRRQGTKFWKDPVATFGDLPNSPTSGNMTGDVRTVTGLNRAFTWNGTDWKALAVDENGRLTTDEIQINSIVVKGTPCSSIGLVARDSNGLTLSCQNGQWLTLSSIEQGASMKESLIILRSDYGAPEPAGAVLFTGPITYDAANDTYTAKRTTSVMPSKDGLLIIHAASAMAVGVDSDPSAPEPVGAQVLVSAEIINKDTGVSVGQSIGQSPIIGASSTRVAIFLSKTLGKNMNGYDIVIRTIWQTWGAYPSFSPSPGIYHHANIADSNDNIHEITPLETDWSWDIVY